LNTFKLTIADQQQISVNIFRVLCYSHDVKSTNDDLQKAANNVFLKICEKIGSLHSQDLGHLGCLGHFIFYLFNAAYSYNQIIENNNIEIFTYSLPGLTKQYADQLTTHVDLGYVGQIVRTFSMRQFQASKNGKCCPTPNLIVIRDAHRCPSSTDDNYILESKKKYDWVHSIYYHVPWHERYLGDTTTFSIHRGPIFYYINARKTDDGDLCIMPLNHWNYTFGRAFKRDNKFIECRQHFTNNGTIKIENNEFGLCYGVDEYCSTYCVYDETSRAHPPVNCVTDQIVDEMYDNSKWIQMFYNWDIGDRNCKEGRAFTLAAAYIFQTYGQQHQTVPIKAVYQFIQDIDTSTESVPQILKIIKEYIPQRNQIHGLISYAHDSRTAEWIHGTMTRNDQDIKYLEKNGEEIATYILGHREITNIKFAEFIDLAPAKLQYDNNCIDVMDVDIAGGDSRLLNQSKQYINDVVVNKFSEYEKNALKSIESKGLLLSYSEAKKLLYTNFKGYFDKLPRDYLDPTDYLDTDRRKENSDAGMHIMGILNHCIKDENNPNPNPKDLFGFGERQVDLSELRAILTRDYKKLKVAAEAAVNAAKGGKPAKTIVYNKKSYTVKQDKSKTSYIICKKVKTFLKDIRGKYRYLA
jgi:hypothetical protein